MTERSQVVLQLRNHSGTRGALHHISELHFLVSWHGGCKAWWTMLIHV